MNETPRLYTYYNSLIDNHLMTGNPLRLTNKKYDLENVIEEFDRIITEGNPDLEAIKEAFGDAGKEHFLAGDYRRAAEYYRYALELISDYINTRMNQARIQYPGVPLTQNMFVPLRKLGGSRTRRSKSARSTRRLRKRLH